MDTTRSVEDVLVGIDKKDKSAEVMLVDTHFAFAYKGISSDFLYRREHKWLLAKKIRSFNPVTNIIVFEI